MARIAGLKTIKNSSGKVTHVTLSMRHHSEILQNLLDLSDMDKARKGATVDWKDAKKVINKKHRLRD
jgi:hypothetical protein